MLIEEKKTDGKYVLVLKGRLDVNEAASVEDMLVSRVHDTSYKEIYLNLSGLEYLSSSGIRVFVNIMRLLEEEGRKLMVCNPSESVRKVFSILELSDKFYIGDC